MNCPTCNGKSTIPPCPDCEGVGIVHCCDGLQETGSASVLVAPFPKIHERPINVGDKVVKRSGYHYPGVVVSVFHTTAGLTRYVVEADAPEFAGMLHIFSRDQLIGKD